MRVVHYQPHFLGPDSGTANAVRGWTEALARFGADVSVLVDRAVAERPSPANVEVVGLKHSLRGALRFPHNVSQAFAGADVVVLHGGWVLGNVVVGRECARYGLPFVLSTHGVYDPGVFQTRRVVKGIWATTLERPYLRRALAVHVFFPEQAAHVERLGVHIPTIVAPNGVAIPEADQWDGGSGSYLLWLGRFHMLQKGLDLLVQAIARIHPHDRPNVRLHGPDWRGQKERVRSLVNDLEVDRWITIGEPVYGDAKRDLIRRASGCVYPSRSDACPVAVLEAAAMGVPTLVAGYPLGEFLAARHAAVRVQHDPASVAQGIAYLTSPAGPGLGAQARSVARESLSWEAVAQSWMSQLTKVMAQEHRGPDTPSVNA